MMTVASLGKYYYELYNNMKANHEIENELQFFDMFLRDQDANVLLAFVYYCIKDKLSLAVVLKYNKVQVDHAFRERLFNDMVDIIETFTDHMLSKFNPTEKTPISDDTYHIHRVAYETLFFESVNEDDVSYEMLERILMNMESCILDYYNFVKENTLSIYLFNNGHCYEVNQLNISLINESKFRGNGNIIVQTQYFTSLIFYYWILDYWNIIPREVKIYVPYIWDGNI